jgi:hypothetical protein
LQKVLPLSLQAEPPWKILNCVQLKIREKQADLKSKRRKNKMDM